jgi:hypothetical protein
VAPPVVGAVLSVSEALAPLLVRGAEPVQVDAPTDQENDWAAQLALVVAQVAPDCTVNAPLEQEKVAPPVSGPVASVIATLLPLAVAGAAAEHDVEPTVHTKEAALQFTTALQVPVAVATPEVHETLAVPTAGPVVSLTVELLPSAPPPYAALQLWLPVDQLTVDAPQGTTGITICPVAR